MFDKILEALMENPTNFKIIEASFREGQGLSLVEDEFKGQLARPSFLDFKDVEVVQCHEIIKGLTTVLKLDAAYEIGGQPRTLTFALVVRTSKGLENPEILDMKMKA